LEWPKVDKNENKSSSNALLKEFSKISIINITAEKYPSVSNVLRRTVSSKYTTLGIM